MNELLNNPKIQTLLIELGAAVIIAVIAKLDKSNTIVKFITKVIKVLESEKK